MGCLVGQAIFSTIIKHKAIFLLLITTFNNKQCQLLSNVGYTLLGIFKRLSRSLPLCTKQLFDLTILPVQAQAPNIQYVI